MKHFNSSSIAKIKEYESLFKEDIVSTDIDLPEIRSSDPILVMAHKVSSVPPFVFVDDTSLFVDGEIGTEIRWLLPKLSSCVGKRAHYLVLLAYHDGEQVFIFQGETWGVIVEENLDSHPEIQMEKYFMPDGYNTTIDKVADKEIRPRTKVVNNYKKGIVFANVELPGKWLGEWQG